MKNDFTVEQWREIEIALERDTLIDLVTVGRKTRTARRVEIWFHRIDGRIIITGTPRPRDWLANIKTNPEIGFCLKDAVSCELKATACVITDPRDRRDILTRPETEWYRRQGFTLEQLVGTAPVVEVWIEDRPLNDRH